MDEIANHGTRLNGRQTVQILQLLAEYTAKLRGLVSDRERLLMQLGIGGVSLLALAFAPSLLAYAITFDTHKGGPNDLTISFLFGGGMFSGVVAFAMYHYWIGRMRSVRADIEVVWSQLRTLVQIASQAEDHVEQDLVKRVTLDLRLSEALALLRQAGGGIEPAVLRQAFTRQGAIGELLEELTAKRAQVK